MSESSVDRRRILRSLLELDRPLDAVLGDLAGVAWDSEEELVILQPGHVIDMLNRFKSGRYGTEDVERWANAIEGRDDIGLKDESRALLKEAIFDLANPDLQGALTIEVAERWVERLSAVRGEDGTPGTA
jgi:hypothetical protein